VKLTLLPLSALLLSACAPMATHQGLVANGFDAGGYSVVICDAAYAGKPAACMVSGSGDRQLLRGNLISNGRMYVGGSLLVGADGRIEAAGCAVPVSTVNAMQAAKTVTIDCPGAVISAGFVNLHEHIDYSYQQPAQPPTSKWIHRNQWRPLPAAERGFEGDAPKDETVRAEVSERAMLRHALSGSTAISGAKDYRAYLRNLKLADVGSVMAAPGGKPVLDSTFPLNDAGTLQWPTAPCKAAQVAGVRVNRDNPFVPHVGEGTNEGAQYEVDCVLDAIRGKTTPTAFIHGVAISEAQIPRLQAQDVGVVLSPRSNFQLYAAAPPVTQLKAAGVTLSLGTDWSPSGSLTMLDEARCLARYNHDKLGGQLSAADVHRMLTENGAKAVGLQGQIGRLAVGELADAVIIDTEGRRSLSELLDKTALKQTVAVFVGGKAASFPSAWAGKLPQLDNCASDPRDLCGQQRTVCGANAQRPLSQLLKQAIYTIDDAKICTPQPTNDCVAK